MDRRQIYRRGRETFRNRGQYKVKMNMIYRQEFEKNKRERERKELPQKLERLPELLKNLNWEIEGERRKFQSEFISLLEMNRARYYLPDHLVFQKKELDYLLRDSPLNGTLCQLVARNGYTDKPDVDKDGKPVTRCTTALHLAVRCGFKIDTSRVTLIDIIFCIYNRFDVNYTDDDGLTHLHAACKYDLYDIVEKFLNFGNDPNCVVSSTGYSTLHFALQIKKLNRRRKMFILLMKNGANPNLADAEGQTPLHIISNDRKDYGPGYDCFLAEILFTGCDKKYRPMHVNVRNKEGNTPLNVALKTGNKSMVELLLRKGADPTLADADGVVPRDIINRDEDLAAIFREKCAIKPSSSS